MLDVTKNILLTFKGFCMNFSLELKKIISSHPVTSKQPHKIVQIVYYHRSPNTYETDTKEPHALCRDLADRPKDRRHKGQILAVWFQTDLQPLWQNLCLASDSKKVKTKSSLNSLGITDMVLDNQWASN